jgi:DNA-binding transcriptional MerR regulator
VAYVNITVILTVTASCCNLGVVDEDGSTPGWTLDELSSLAEARLAALGLLDEPPDGRVARAADPRTVRYYQSLGILDRPLSYEGHKARYGPRHLLQLLAVKALQRHRLPLSEIQERLYGKSDAELESVLASIRPPARAVVERQALRVKTVREVVIAPGLKVTADEGWVPGDDPELLVAKFRAALAAFVKS